MAVLPAGTATFLFPDIEGSTQLLQQLGAFDQYGGTEMDIHLILSMNTMRAGVFWNFTP